jgi:hypothetical protein
MASTDNGLNGANKVGWGGIACHITARAGFDCFDNIAFIGLRRHEDDPNLFLLPRDFARDSDSIEIPEIYVQQDDLRAAIFSEHYRLPAAGGLPNDRKTRLALQQQAKAVSNDRVVVGDEYADWLHSGRQ